MLEKPNVPDEKIIACLQNDYGLAVSQLTFLPLGADINTVVYRVEAGGTAYFLKLRSGPFDETSVALPHFFSEQGISQIIAPLTTQTGRLWATMDDYATILYPFIEGRNGYGAQMSTGQWAEFGAALKQLHSLKVPVDLRRRIRTERYDPAGRELVKQFLVQIETEHYADPVASEMAAFMREKRTEILDLVAQAERLAQRLQAQAPPFIVCHSDIHAGNLLLTPAGKLYIVDWDEPILAPKERDLMYIGGGLLASGLSPQEEEARFYPSYGHPQIDAAALAYYRYERIIQDIAAYGEQLLLSDEGDEDRAQSLYYFKSNFLPNSTIEIAYQSDQT